MRASSGIHLFFLFLVCLRDASAAHTLRGAREHALLAPHLDDELSSSVVSPVQPLADKPSQELQFLVITVPGREENMARMRRLGGSLDDSGF